jgi:putative transposase
MSPFNDIYQGMQYKTRNRVKFYLKAYLVFVVKYRQKILDIFGNDMLSYFSDVSSTYGFIIDKMEYDEDHIHLLLSYSPTDTISEIVKNLKQIATYRLWKSREKELKRYFYRKHIFWTHSYFISSIGESNEEVVRQYINNQR